MKRASNTRISVTVGPKELVRISGVLWALGGFTYIFIQLIHPLDALASVVNQTGRWILVAVLTSLMSLFNAVGLTGSYAMQSRKAGLLGLIAYAMFAGFWLISMIFSFDEAFIWPLLAISQPDFVEGMTGLFNGGASGFDLGIFPGLASVAGLSYILGGVLFGIASLRAGVVSRASSVGLLIASVATMGTALVHHPYDRIFAVPMGLALIGLGIDSIRWARDSATESA